MKSSETRLKTEALLYQPCQIFATDFHLIYANGFKKLTKPFWMYAFSNTIFFVFTSSSYKVTTKSQSACIRYINFN